MRKTPVHLRYAIAFSLIIVAGCASTSDVTNSTITVNGEEYLFRTSTVQGINGPYELSQVKVRSLYYACLPESPGDCEAVVQSVVDQRPGDG